jgi:hypothetical protein
MSGGGSGVEKCERIGKGLGWPVRRFSWIQ